MYLGTDANNDNKSDTGGSYSSCRCDYTLSMTRSTITKYSTLHVVSYKIPRLFYLLVMPNFPKQSQNQVGGLQMDSRHVQNFFSILQPPELHFLPRIY